MNSCTSETPRSESLNDALIFLRKAGFARKLLYIIAIRLGTGYAARRGVGLLQIAGVGQVRHHVADGGRAESFPIRPRQGARPHRVAGGNKGLHNGGQNLPFPLPDGWSRRHIKYL